MASGSNQSLTRGEELLVVIVGSGVLMVVLRALLSPQRTWGSEPRWDRCRPRAQR